MNNIELHLGNKTEIINLKIPLMFIIGNSQGGDAICGRHMYYGKTAQHISRMCDAIPKHLAKARIGKCKRNIMQDVMDYVTNNDTSALFDLYQAPHWIS